MVVVEVAGVDGVVVVVLVVVGGVEQPVIDTRTAATKHERMIFFINVIIVWFVT